MIDKGTYDVIIIGGGITGAGTARDCALRGLKVLLVERGDLAMGASGRNHGLLHSGARYAVTDSEGASECIVENEILKRIAAPYIMNTDGLFITLPEDDLGYQATFIEACQRVGIGAEAISPEEALRLEPSANPALIGAVRVPDGSVEPFGLVAANVLDARLNGAEVLTYHEVVGFVRSGNRIEGVELRDMTTGESVRATASVTVNAAGIWGAAIAQMAGVEVRMYPAKGSLLVFGRRVNKMVINRCRRPADADILVPGGGVCVIGATSERIPFEDVDKNEVTVRDVDLLLSEGAKLAPQLSSTRILRAYAGVRPLVADDDDPTGRGISRGIVCLDHAERDGLEGFVTITGGKLMTYRLMAEMAADMVCRKLGNGAQSTTATTPLPNIKQRTIEGTSHKTSHFVAMGKSEKSSPMVCVCEGVSVDDVRGAVENMGARSVTDLRRRMRLGMGGCMEHFCSLRAAGVLAEQEGAEVTSVLEGVEQFLDERWRGVRPVAWGESLAAAQFTRWYYGGVCGLTKKENE